jgi:hypothetical protein
MAVSYFLALLLGLLDSSFIRVASPQCSVVMRGAKGELRVESP